LLSSLSPLSSHLPSPPLIFLSLSSSSLAASFSTAHRRDGGELGGGGRTWGGGGGRRRDRRPVAPPFPSPPLPGSDSGARSGDDGRRAAAPPLPLPSPAATPARGRATTGEELYSAHSAKFAD
uniref:Uncharacterized protein n=1 Tax=Oryza meridionalis TaxID=40149 RepID=A0A0E0F4Q5_9ORYZ